MSKDQQGKITRLTLVQKNFLLKELEQIKDDKIREISNEEIGALPRNNKDVLIRAIKAGNKKIMLTPEEVVAKLEAKSGGFFESADFYNTTELARLAKEAEAVYKAAEKKANKDKRKKAVYDKFNELRSRVMFDGGIPIDVIGLLAELRNMK
jgi:hypothetical protein